MYLCGKFVFRSYKQRQLVYNYGESRGNRYKLSILYTNTY